MQFEIIHQESGDSTDAIWNTSLHVQYMHHQYSRMRPAFWSAQPADQRKAYITSSRFVHHVFVDGSSNVERIVPSRREQDDLCENKSANSILFRSLSLNSISVSCSWHMADHEWQSSKFHPIQLETYDLTKLDKHTNYISNYILSIVNISLIYYISFLSRWSIISNVNPPPQKKKTRSHSTGVTRLACYVALHASFEPPPLDTAATSSVSSRLFSAMAWKASVSTNLTNGWNMSKFAGKRFGNNFFYTVILCFVLLGFLFFSEILPANVCPLLKSAVFFWIVFFVNIGPDLPKDVFSLKCGTPHVCLVLLHVIYLSSGSWT